MEGFIVIKGNKDRIIYEKVKEGYERALNCFNDGDNYKEVLRGRYNKSLEELKYSLKL